MSESSGEKSIQESSYFQEKLKIENNGYWMENIKNKINIGLDIELNEENIPLFVKTLLTHENIPQLCKSLNLEEAKWLFSNSSDPLNFIDQYCQENSIDKNVLEKVHWITAINFLPYYDPSFPILVKNNYKFYENIVKHECDLALLKKSMSKNSIGKIDFSSYNLEQSYLSGKNFSGYMKGYGIESSDINIRNQFYLDAPVGLILKYKNIANAIITFWPISSDTVMIRQIQGVREMKRENGNLKQYSSEGLYGLNWEDSLIEYVMEVSKKLGYKKIIIQSAINNPWTKPNNPTGDGKIHFPLERAKKRFDEPAERLLFVRKEDKNFYKDI